MLSNYIAEVPINGFEHQAGGNGVNIPFSYLETELKKTLSMKPDELISQVNVTEEGLVFYFSKKEK